MAIQTLGARPAQALPVLRCGQRRRGTEDLRSRLRALVLRQAAGHRRQGEWATGNALVDWL